MASQTLQMIAREYFRWQSSWIKRRIKFHNGDLAVWGGLKSQLPNWNGFLIGREKLNADNEQKTCIVRCPHQKNVTLMIVTGFESKQLLLPWQTILINGITSILFQSLQPLINVMVHLVKAMDLCCMPLLNIWPTLSICLAVILHRILKNWSPVTAPLPLN